MGERVECPNKCRPTNVKLLGIPERRKTGRWKGVAKTVRFKCLTCGTEFEVHND